jgi:hypothetical protein
LNPAAQTHADVAMNRNMGKDNNDLTELVFKNIIWMTEYIISTKINTHMERGINCNDGRKRTK